MSSGGGGGGKKGDATRPGVTWEMVDRMFDEIHSNRFVFLESCGAVLAVTLMFGRSLFFSVCINIALVAAACFRDSMWTFAAELRWSWLFAVTRGRVGAWWKTAAGHAASRVPEPARLAVERAGRVADKNPRAAHAASTGAYAYLVFALVRVSLWMSSLLSQEEKDELPIHRAVIPNWDHAFVGAFLYMAYYVTKVLFASSRSLVHIYAQGRLPNTVDVRMFLQELNECMAYHRSVAGDGGVPAPTRRPDGRRAFKYRVMLTPAESGIAAAISSGSALSLRDDPAAAGARCVEHINAGSPGDVDRRGVPEHLTMEHGPGEIVSSGESGLANGAGALASASRAALGLLASLSGPGKRQRAGRRHRRRTDKKADDGSSSEEEGEQEDEAEETDDDDDDDDGSASSQDSDCDGDVGTDGPLREGHSEDIESSSLRIKCLYEQGAGGDEALASLVGHGAGELDVHLVANRCVPGDGDDGMVYAAYMGRVPAGNARKLTRRERRELCRDGCEVTVPLSEMFHRVYLHAFHPGLSSGMTRAAAAYVGAHPAASSPRFKRVHISSTGEDVHIHPVKMDAAKKTMAYITHPDGTRHCEHICPYDQLVAYIQRERTKGDPICNKCPRGQAPAADAPAKEKKRAAAPAPRPDASRDHGPYSSDETAPW